MSLVNRPIQCVTCKGDGFIIPIFANYAFGSGSSEQIRRICDTCRGEGTIKNLVFVNPTKEEQEIQEFPETNIKNDDDIYQADVSEILSNIKEIKEIQHKKKNKKFVIEKSN